MIVRNKRSDRNDGRYLRRFAPEVNVYLGTQTYRKQINLSSLLLNYLLGKEPSFSKVRSNVVHNTESLLVLCVASRRRIQEIFTVGELNGAEIYERKSKRWFALCGKVQIKYRNGKAALAYILDEDNDHWILRTDNNQDGRCSKVPFSRGNGTFEYGGVRGKITSTTAQSNFQVTNYWPIRIRISLRLQQMSIIGSRMVYERDEDVMMLDDKLCT